MKPTTSLVTLALILILTTTPSQVTSSISCLTVYSNLSPCRDYVSDTTQSTPSQDCCDGVTNLLSACKTRSDRQSVCKCIKSVASNAGGGPTFDRAAGIPATCGSPLPYTLTPNMDCTKIN
ncbi:hypothetical protein LUZ60_011027 [Juncus effusus]|nr:hypothetical protein LUZ60_011027 [Juncus effusus]